MVGVIRRRDIIAHPVVTIRSFGWRVFLKTLVAGRNRTFLSVLMETDVLGVRSDEVPEIVEQCIQLELRAARLYESLAETFAELEGAREFFLHLAREEDMLEIGRVEHAGREQDNFRVGDVLRRDFAQFLV